MREFAQGEIEGTRQYLEKQRYPVESGQVGDLQVSYYVIPELKKMAQWFAEDISRLAFQSPSIS